MGWVVRTDALPERHGLFGGLLFRLVLMVAAFWSAPSIGNRRARYASDRTHISVYVFRPWLFENTRQTAYS